MNNYIRMLVFALFTIMTIFLPGISIATQPESTTSKIEQSPETIVATFYRWYIHSLNQNYDPLVKGRAMLKKFVAAGLIDEIEDQLKRPGGLSADYFLQAQDWFDNWESNISVTKAVIKKQVATSIVTLGAKNDSRHKLIISLTQESGTWKIRRVQQFRQ